VGEDVVVPDVDVVGVDVSDGQVVNRVIGNDPLTYPIDLGDTIGGE